MFKWSCSNSWTEGGYTSGHEILIHLLLWQKHTEPLQQPHPQPVLWKHIYDNLRWYYFIKSSLPHYHSIFYLLFCRQTDRRASMNRPNDQNHTRFSRNCFSRQNRNHWHFPCSSKIDPWTTYLSCVLIIWLQRYTLWVTDGLGGVANATFIHNFCGRNHFTMASNFW